MLIRMIFPGVLIYAVLILGFLAPHQAFAAPRTILILNSQPGDYIGGGIVQTYKPTDGPFIVRRASNGGISVSFHTPSYSHWWYLSFAPQRGKKLIIGQYEGAIRNSFQSPLQPGLSASGDGRGCNELSGRFLVSEVTRDTAGRVQSLAIDFEQHCEHRQSALYGSIRYYSGKSIIPRVSIGDAIALKGNAGDSDATAIVALSMPSSKIVTALFATADATAQQGTDYQAQSGQVVFQPGETVQRITVPVIGNKMARGTKAFAINLSNNGAPIGDRSAEVRILDPNVPMTALTMNSQPRDYVGQGRTWLFTTADTTLIASRNYYNGVSVSVGAPHHFTLSMAGPSRTVLLPGIYENTQRFPFQPPGVPGLDMSGDGRGCNTSTGRFVVNQAGYAGDGGVEDFSADFEQHCEGAPPALFGSVRVNAILRQASVTNAVIRGSTAKFTVTLNPASTTPESVTFATFDGTALAGIDYKPVSKIVRFAPGETKKTISVPLLRGASAGEQFFGKLSATTTPLWIGQGTATIE